jgi:hypothetical protein
MPYKLTLLYNPVSRTRLGSVHWRMNVRKASSQGLSASYMTMRPRPFGLNEGQELALIAS